jgi:Nif-specific regulatory protein
MLPVRFEKLRQISGGDLFETYEAVDRITSRKLLVKLPAEISTVPLEDRNQLLRQSHAALLRLKHRAIVLPRLLVEDDGRTAVAFDYYPEQLRVALTPELFRDQHQVLLPQMFMILDFVHAMGWVHGDIKQSNWLIVKHACGLRVLLTDFDFICRSGSKPNRRIYGSLGHIAPELLRDEVILPQSDHYALGSMIARLISRESAAEETISEMLESGLERKIPSSGSVLPGMEKYVSVLERLTQLHYQDRPAHLGMLLEEQRTVLGIADATYQNRLTASLAAAHWRQNRSDSRAPGEVVDRFLTQDASIFGIPGEMVTDLVNRQNLNFIGRARSFAGWLREARVKRYGDCWHVGLDTDSIARFYHHVTSAEELSGSGERARYENRIREALRYHVKRKFLRSKIVLSSVIDEIRQSGSNDCHNSLGHLLAKLGDVNHACDRREDARKCYLEALSLGGLTPLKRIMVCLRLTDMAVVSLDVLEYRSTYNEAYRLAKMLNRGDLKARILTKRLWLTFYAGRMAAALCRFRVVERMARRDNLPNRLALATNGIASIYWATGRLTDAADYYTAGTKIPAPLVSRSSLAALYMNLGLVHMDMGLYRKSVKFLRAALKELDQFGSDATKSTVYNTLAACYCLLGKYAAATELLRLDFWLHSRRGDVGGIARAHWVMGWVEMRAGRYGDAFSLLKKSLDAFSSLSLTQFEGKAALYLATLCFWQGRLVAAKQLLGSAMRLVSPTKNKVHSLDAKLLAMYLELEEDPQSLSPDRLRALFEEYTRCPSYLEACYCLLFLLQAGRPMDAVALADSDVGLQEYLRDSGGVLAEALNLHLTAFRQGEAAAAGVDINILKRAFVGYTNAHLNYYAIIAARQIAEYYARRENPRLADKFLGEAYYLADQLDNASLMTAIEAERGNSRVSDEGGIPALQVLYRISALLNKLPDYRRAVEQLLQYAIDLTGAERGAIVIADEAGQSVRVEASLECDSQSVEDIVTISRGVIKSVFEKAEVMVVDNALDDNTTKSYKSVILHNILSIACAPLVIDDRVIGALYLDHHSLPGLFSRQDRETVQAIANFIAVVLSQARMVRSMQYQSVESDYLLKNHGVDNPFLTRSSTTLDIIEKIPLIAASDACVLLRGESGTGKEIIAKMIHEKSHRSDGPFIRLNCAILEGSLLESELFGIEKGIATGVNRREGKLQAADGGTLFLDEIGDMPMPTQAKLLRALEVREFEMTGSNETQSVDVRFIAATNKNLDYLITQGTFRSDLLYRVNTVEIVIPPLRERPDDVELLVQHFCSVFARERSLHFTRNAIDALRSYSWPGNVRELRNLIEKLSILTTSKTIDTTDLPPEIAKFGVPPAYLPLRSMTAETEKQMILQLLQRFNWNQSAVARELKLPLTSLQRRIRKYGLVKPKTPPTDN